MKDTSNYPIRAVSQRTGLSAHVIRAWEKRYGFPEPARSETNRRFYSQTDIETLLLLKQLIDKGYAIGQIARLQPDELRQLLATVSGSKANRAEAGTEAGSVAEESLVRCLDAVNALSAETLLAVLRQATLTLSKPHLLEKLISPLMEEIGNRWERGELRVANEHMASAVVRTFLVNLLDAATPDAEAPAIVVTTPRGQTHEIGALMVAVRAASLGWRVTYLGADLPSDEIGAAALTLKATAIALSLVHPAGRIEVVHEIHALHDALPAVPIIVGGRSIESYRLLLEARGIDCLASLADLPGALQRKVHSQKPSLH